MQHLSLSSRWCIQVYRVKVPLIIISNDNCYLNAFLQVGQVHDHASETVDLWTYTHNAVLC